MFFKKPKKSLKKITHMRIIGVGLIDPLLDITPLESAHLCILITCAMQDSRGDFYSYARDHDLLRHFETDKNPPPDAS